MFWWEPTENAAATFASLYKKHTSSSRVFVRVRAGSVIGRVQEFLTAAHYGCELSALRGVLKKVRGDRGEWGVSGCSPRRRTPRRNRPPPPPASPAASSWPPAAPSRSSSADRRRNSETNISTNAHLNKLWEDQYLKTPAAWWRERERKGRNEWMRTKGRTWAWHQHQAL